MTAKSLLSLNVSKKFFVMTCVASPLLIAFLLSGLSLFFPYSDVIVIYPWFLLSFFYYLITPLIWIFNAMGVTSVLLEVVITIIVGALIYGCVAYASIRKTKTPLSVKRLLVTCALLNLVMFGVALLSLYLAGGRLIGMH